jgi:hypothetical protein
MKLLYIFGIVFLFSVSLASAALTDNLVSYWTFDGNAEDSVGSNDGTVTGATYGASYGIINGAYSYDGSGDYIDVGNSSTLNPTTALTVAAWIKIPASPDSSDVIFAKRSSTAYAYDMSFSSASGLMYWRINSNTYAAISTTDFRDNTYHFIVGTYDKSKIYLYVDGELEDDYTYSSDINKITEKLYFGRRGAGFTTANTGYLTGYIDELGLWSRALSQSEITALYNSGSGLQYPFITGDDCDYSGTGNWVIDESCHVDTNTRLQAGYSMIVNDGATVFIDSGVTVN